MMGPAALLMVGLKALASVPLDALRVGRLLLLSLVRRPSGQQGMLQVQPFRQGRRGDPWDAGRRALVTLGLSLAPNSFVLDASSEGGLVLHRLQAVPPRPDQDWPV